MTIATKAIPDTAGEKLLPPESIARLMGVSIDTVRRLALTKGLPYHQIGGRRKYYESEVRAWIGRQKQEEMPAESDSFEGKLRPISRAAAKSSFDAEIRAYRTRKF